MEGIGEALKGVWTAKGDLAKKGGLSYRGIGEAVIGKALTGGTAKGDRIAKRGGLSKGRPESGGSPRGWPLTGG